MGWMGITVFALIFHLVHAQALHFDIFEVTLEKTTHQSPAHWYMEIFNDVGTDTTLRWETWFHNIDPQWTITFDDQNASVSPFPEGAVSEMSFFRSKTNLRIT